MRILSVTPLLRIFDEAKAKEYYLDFLGFTLDWEHRFGEAFPIYLSVSRGGAALHLTEHHGDCAPGAKTILTIDGLAAFHAELSAKDYRYAKPGLEDWIGGGKVLETTDPFFNRLAFVGDA